MGTQWFMWNTLHARITKETYSLPSITAIRERKKWKRTCNISMEVKLKIHLYQCSVPMVSTQNSPSALPKSSQCPSLQTQACLPSPQHVLHGSVTPSQREVKQVWGKCKQTEAATYIFWKSLFLCGKCYCVIKDFYIWVIVMPWDCASSAKDGDFHSPG